MPSVRLVGAAPSSVPDDRSDDRRRKVGDDRRNEWTDDAALSRNVEQEAINDRRGQDDPRPLQRQRLQPRRNRERVDGRERPQPKRELDDADYRWNRDDEREIQ